jgi:hypothetical protein
MLFYVHKAGAPFLQLATSIFLLSLLVPVAAEQWQQPSTTTLVETASCNRQDNDGDAHGLVCLKLDCVGSQQYRFTIVADYEFFGNTTFFAGPHSITLNMEEYRSNDVTLTDWNVSRASVPFDFLRRIAREHELAIRCEGCNSIALTLKSFAAELRRISAACNPVSLFHPWNKGPRLAASSTATQPVIQTIHSSGVITEPAPEICTER